jgi:hypothetical protein
MTTSGPGQSGRTARSAWSPQATTTRGARRRRTARIWSGSGGTTLPVPLGTGATVSVVLSTQMRGSESAPGKANKRFFPVRQAHNARSQDGRGQVPFA